MQFSKIAAVLSFAAFVVATPAPAADAAPAAVVEARTTYKPNACKQGDKYYSYTSKCPKGDSYYCRTTANIAVANCINILSGNSVDVPSDLIMVSFQ